MILKQIKTKPKTRERYKRFCETKFRTKTTPSSFLDDILISGQSNDGLAGKLDSLAFYR